MVPKFRTSRSVQREVFRGSAHHRISIQSFLNVAECTQQCAHEWQLASRARNMNFQEWFSTNFPLLTVTPAPETEMEVKQVTMTGKLPDQCAGVCWESMIPLVATRTFSPCSRNSRFLKSVENHNVPTFVFTILNQVSMQHKQFLHQWICLFKTFYVACFSSPNFLCKPRCARQQKESKR